MSDFFVGPAGDADQIKLGPAVASGSEGVLYRGAITTGSGEIPVAVKMLQPAHLDQLPRWTARWEAQAELLRRVKLPGLVAVRDAFVGPLPHPYGVADPNTASLYLVMDWIEGVSLDRWARNLENPEPEQLLQALVPVAAALDMLHSGAATDGVPVVHRDIKPANILMRPSGDTVLVDLGSMRGLDGEPRKSGVTGTLGYLAPEAARDGDYSPASDRYSLGAVAFFLMTEQEPPLTATIDDLRRVLIDAPRVGGRVDVVEHVLAMLSPDRNTRPTAAANWVAQLRRSSLSLLPGDVVIAPIAPARNPQLQVAAKPRPRFGLLARASVVIVVVAVVVGVGVGMILRQPDGKGPSAPVEVSKIAFVRMTDDGSTPLYVAPIGGLAQRLSPANSRASHPSWSPDGRTLAFDQDEISADNTVRTSQVLLVPASGGAPRVLTNGQWPSWSPDGASVLIVDVGGIWNVSVKTPQDRTALRNNGCGGAPHYGIQPCEDGVMHRDFLAPVYSPDGSQVAYVVEEEFENNPSRFHSLWVMNADGTDNRQLVFQVTSAASWSPDGTRLAYFADGDGIVTKAGVYSVDTSGSDLRLQTPCCVPAAAHFGLPGAPRWTVDGRNIISLAADGAYVTRGRGLDRISAYSGRLDAAPFGEPHSVPSATPPQNRVCPSGADCKAIATRDFDGDGRSDRLALYMQGQDEFAALALADQPVTTVKLGFEPGALYGSFYGFRTDPSMPGVQAFVANGHGTFFWGASILYVRDGRLHFVALDSVRCESSENDEVCGEPDPIAVAIYAGNEKQTGFLCTSDGFATTSLIPSKPLPSNDVEYRASVVDWTWTRKAFRWVRGELQPAGKTTGVIRSAKVGDPVVKALVGLHCKGIASTV